jgi:citrate lyase subunit alpha/citrate CoA-transferase
MTIKELKDLAEKITGKPNNIKLSEDIVAVVEYRDGTVIDVVKKVID